MPRGSKSWETRSEPFRIDCWQRGYSFQNSLKHAKTILSDWSLTLSEYCAIWNSPHGIPTSKQLEPNFQNIQVPAFSGKHQSGSSVRSTFGNKNVDGPNTPGMRRCKEQVKNQVYTYVYIYTPIHRSIHLSIHPYNHPSNHPSTPF